MGYNFLLFDFRIDKKYKKTLLPYTEKIWASTFSLPTRPSLNKRDWKMIEKSVLKQN